MAVQRVVDPKKGNDEISIRGKGNCEFPNGKMWEWRLRKQMPGITGMCLTVGIYSDGPNKQTHWGVFF